MREIMIERSTVNIEALDATLRTALGQAISGVSSRAGQVIVHLSATVSQAQIDQARSIVIAHDPAQLTAEQQAEIDRRQALETARAANTTPLNTADYNSETAAIQQLAQKIAWLEQEIDNLQQP